MTRSSITFLALGAALVPVTLSCASGAPFCSKIAGGVVVTTARLRIEIVDGVIVSARDPRSGEVYADATLNDIKIPRGMGHLTGDPAQAGLYHSPWGTYNLYTENPSFHHPFSDSTLEVSSSSDTCAVAWTKLSNGTTVYPDEKLRVDLRKGSAGDLLYRATATSPRPGVFGAMIPVANLQPALRIYVPSLGGVMYDRTLPPSIRTFERGPFWEAPVVAVESKRGSLGIWIEDPGFKQSNFFLSWTGTSFGVGIEQYNPLPQTDLTQAATTDWHIDAFTGGWVDAMTPYKSWYSNQFSAELARRATPSWPDKIQVIVDRFMDPDNDRPERPPTDPSHPELSYAFLRDTFGAGKVLVHEWDARKARFDTELPDYTVKRVCNRLSVYGGLKCTDDAACRDAGHPGGACIQPYPERNELLGSYGLKTIGYVNSYCANFGTPAFKSANVAANGLDRKLGWFYDYYRGMPHNFANACPPNDDPASPSACDCTPSDPSHLCPYGDYLYLDPLSAWWRKDHITRMLRWKQQTGFDANYEDTAGFGGDFGNGTVGDLSGAQGSVKMFQDLQVQLGIPMATEFGPDSVAFAARWAFRGNMVWGVPDRTNQEFLVTHQRPVNSFLYGPGQVAWVPTVPARTNFEKLLVASTADSLGSAAPFRADRFSYRADRGALGHLRDRAVLFARNGLKPYYERARGADTLVSRYQDTQGNKYEFHIDGNEQRFVGPGSVVQYARITGATSKATSSLWIKGWPANSTSRRASIIGLEPRAYYALSGDPRASSNIQIEEITSSVPEGVKVAKYYETSTHVVLVLSARSGLPSPPASVTAQLYTNVPIRSTILNDQPVRTPSWDAAAGRSSIQAYTATLPARFVFAKVDGTSTPLDRFLAAPSDIGHFIEKETGIDRGGEELPLYTVGEAGMKIELPNTWVPAIMPAYGENAPQTIDWLIRPESADSVLQVYTCAGSAPSDGVISINGREVYRTSSLPGCNYQSDRPPDKFELPLGQYQGRDVLVSIAMDDGADDDPDGDLRYFSNPRLISARRRARKQVRAMIEATRRTSR